MCITDILANLKAPIEDNSLDYKALPTLFCPYSGLTYCPQLWLGSHAQGVWVHY